MIQNLEQTLTKQVEQAKADSEAYLFGQWKVAKTPEKREELHAEIRALNDLTFRLIKSIRGNNDG